jgi:type I restriction enzyme S subunit
MKLPWQTKKLGDKEYFEILGSGIEKFEGEKEYLSTSSIEGNKIIAPEGKITYQQRPSRANMQPQLNSVWFARMINTIKVYSFTEANKDEIDKYILSTGFAGILCNPEKVDPRYLEKIFLSKWFNDLKDSLASDKAIQKSLNNDDIANLEIPLPPLPIQQKIVKILDTIQSAVEIQEKIIEKTKELKKSLMNLLFHYGLAGLRVKELASSRVGELTSSEIEKLGLKLKKTEIGEIPENWEVVRLGEYFEFKNGINFKKEQKGKGTLVLDVLNMYTESLHPNLNEIYRVEGSFSEEYYLKQGDILFVRSSLKQEGVGWCAVFPGFSEPVLFCGFLIRARPKTEKTDSNFFVYLFRTENFRNQIISQSGVVTITNLSQSILSNLLIPLPPLPEQQEIAEILQTIDQKIEIEKKKKELYHELFKTLLNKIMNQEIDVNLLDY